MATFYDANGAAGACSYDAGTEVMTAAMNTYDYDTANACGDYVKVTGVKNGKSISSGSPICARDRAACTSST